jgi:predicted transcriptional regulator
LKVSEWIHKNPGNTITVPPEWELDKIIDRMLEEQCLRDIYVVSEDGHVIGHLSHKKLVRLLLSEQQPVHTRRQIMERVSEGTAQEIMESHFVFASPDEELDNVLYRQLDRDIEDMPVIDDESKLLGTVNMTAALKAMRKSGI